MNIIRYKQVKLIFIVFILISTLFILYNYVYKIITPPDLKLSKKISKGIVTSKQIDEYIQLEIKNHKKLSNYELCLSVIYMSLNSNLLGRGRFSYTEKDKENTNIFIANLDTEKGLIYSIYNYGNESKLIPKRIDFNKWRIDSNEAINIAKDFYNVVIDDEYHITIHGYKGYTSNDLECWHITLSNHDKGYNSDIWIDPFTGEIINSTYD